MSSSTSTRCLVLVAVFLLGAACREPASPPAEQATAALTVTAANKPPIALDRSVSSYEDFALDVTLRGEDPEGDPLTFAIASPPTHGTVLTLNQNFLSLAPERNYHGPDSFTFTVSDGQTISAPGTVSVTILPVNDVPVAVSASLNTPDDTAIPITLGGSDADGDPLTFAITPPPAHGTLTGTPPNVLYTPAPGYHGLDGFSFTVSDGVATSAAAHISLFVATVNHAPVVPAQAVTLGEDSRFTFTPSGLDEDGDILSFAVASAPAHGTAWAIGTTVGYYPNQNYIGPDSFTLTASDGQATSAPGTVSVTVTPTNDAPDPESQFVSTPEDTATEITLTAMDLEGDPLTFSVLAGPSHGTLSGAPPTLTYTPASDYNGSDSFIFNASDGMATSGNERVSIGIRPVNDAPVAQAQALTVPAGSPTSLTLTGTDIDGDELTYAILSYPETGTLTGAPPHVLYTAPPDFRGTTHVTFSVSDGQASSSAELLLTVQKRSLTVSAAASTLLPAKNQQVRFYANAVDEAGAPIALHWDFGDGQSSQEALPVHVFSAPGVYEVRLKASTATEEASTVLWMRVLRGTERVESGSGGPPLVGVEGSQLSLYANAHPKTNLAWDLGDGSSGSSGMTHPEVPHTWRDDGHFTVQVWTVGTAQFPFSATHTVVIYNTPPVPLPQERVSATVGQPVSVQLSGTDAAGANDPLHWELVSGEGELTPEGLFSWIPSQAGLTTVMTKVLDGDGGEARLAFQIDVGPGDVTPEPNPSPGSGCDTSSRGTSGGLALGLLLLSLAAAVRR